MPENHYEALGLPFGAPVDEIRRRYRQLAREFHPDVNASPDATRRFQRINEAHSVLTDEERRKRYDAMIEAQRRPKSTGTQNRSQPAPAAQSAPRKTAPPASYPKPEKQPPPRDEAQLKAAQAVVDQAEAALVRGNLRRAQELVGKVFESMPTHGGAAAILGDVCRLQGDREKAIRYYTLAVQYEPRNSHYQRRLEELLRITVAPATDSRRTVSFGPPTREQVMRQFKLTAGWMGMIALVFFAALYPGAPAELFSHFAPWLGGWSIQLVVWMFASGALCGGAMAASGLIDRLDTAMMLRQSRQAALPLGVWLTVLGVVWFWAAVVAYAVARVVVGGRNYSLDRMFAALSALTFCFALAYASDPVATLIFGGAPVFLGFLGGWVIAERLEDNAT